MRELVTLRLASPIRGKGISVKWVYVDPDHVPRIARSNLPRFEIPVVDNPGRSDGQGVPVAVGAEGEAGVVAEPGLAAGVVLNWSELPVAFGAAVL